MKPFDTQLLLERIGELLKLQWIYDSVPPTSVAEPMGMLPKRSRHSLEGLDRLARIGDAQGIQEGWG